MSYTADNLFGRTRRIWELDFLRGLAILLMCFDHFAYDLAILPSFFTNFYSAGTDSLFEWNEMGYDFYVSEFRNESHYLFATLFLLITGISCTLTSGKITRVVKLFLFSAGFTAATALIDSVSGMGALVVFGVIHCMAVSVLAYTIIDALFSRDEWLLYFAAIMLVGGIAIPWYAQDFINLTSEFGATDFLYAAAGLLRVGSDHFPLYPCMGIVLIGAYIGKKFYAEKRSLLPRLDGGWNRGFSWIGRRTVWVYVLHQPIIAGIIMVIGLINGLEVF